MPDERRKVRSTRIGPAERRIDKLLFFSFEFESRGPVLVIGATWQTTVTKVSKIDLVFDKSGV
jgi:hypothetical protein